MRLDRWLYHSGLQCTKRMYWQARGRQASGRTFELVQRFSHEVRLIARGLWPDGVAIDENLPIPEAIAETRRLIEQEHTRVLFDAVVEHEGVVVRIDVLERSRRMKWYVTAIKSGGQVQNRHVQDLALQVWAARGAQLDVREASVATLDRSYQRNGELDLQSMFVVRDATPRVEAALAHISERVAKFSHTLISPQTPLVQVGGHCDDPYPCEYQSECWPVLERDDVRLLPSLHGHRKRELLAAGIRRVSEIPEKFVLNERQKRARQAIVENRLLFSEELREELESLAFPLWCIDFEAIAPAIPRYSGCKPWQQIPFQWSAHRVDAVWREPEHFGFLASAEEDPRRAFAESLLETVTGDGPVLVWNKQFEDGRLKELQEHLPQLAPAIELLRTRLVDLLEIVRKHVYHPEFLGSFSIKSVLPALVPEMSYDGLAVARGDEASLVYDRICRDGLEEVERNSLRSSLEQYCLLDTLAMVKILEFLWVRVFARVAG